MKKITALFFSLVFGFVLSLSARAELVFTGDVDDDFFDVPNCFTDPTETFISSGLNISRVCFFYDGGLDRLYIGVKAVDGLIFGDANGDGDPASPPLSDFPNLGGTETFVVSIDLDGDSVSGVFDDETVDLLLGVSDTGSLSALGAFHPSVAYSSFSPGGGFGSAYGNTTTLFASPSASARDLEFFVEDFSLITGEIANPSATIPLQVFSGSVAAEGIGSDFLPSSGSSQAYPLYDFDSDGLMDWQELEQGTSLTSDDSDGDSISDGTEINGENPTSPLDSDSDDDGLLDGEEDANFNGKVDDDETDPNNPDTDGDGISDFTEINGENPTNPLDSDSDDDGLLDGEEDKNQNGKLDDGETDPNNPDTDGGGASDKVEIDNGFNPLDPSDDAEAVNAAGQTGLSGSFDQVQGGGLTCSLNVKASPMKTHPISLALIFVIVLIFWKARQKLF